MTAAEARREWREFKAGCENGRNTAIDLCVAVAGTITIEPLEPYIGAHLLHKQFTPGIINGPFNQLRQICHDHKSIWKDPAPNAIVLLLRIEDLFPDLLSGCLTAPERINDLLAEMAAMAGAIAQLRRDFGGTLIVSTPPYPSLPGFELQDIGQATSGMAIFNAVSQFWTREISQLERVRLFDLHGVLLKVGLTQAHDVRKWLLYRQPYTESCWQEIGRTIGRMIVAEKVSSKKCVVVDLDNTLWAGIIGEDGLDGIQLGDDFPGKAYRDFQRYLVQLKNRGVLLAVASKNNPEDAYEVFDKHDAMILSRSDIAVFEVHWDSKVESIKRIAARLNIGIDSLVFVDDNPKEIAEVAGRLPAVSCVLVPEEIAFLPRLLAETDFFDVAEVTDEDRRRTNMMAADNLRQQTREAMSEEEFRRSLNLKIEVATVEKQHLTRVTQLINKTNQFNLTTIRRTKDEVEALTRSTDALVLAMHIKDKYGDYGLVGVSILKKENRTCVIDTLLMSCRVLGRGAEETFIAKLTEAARSLECEDLRGKYIPTAKNAMVKDLYARGGFTRIGETDEWTMNLHQARKPPEYVEAALWLSVRTA